MPLVGYRVVCYADKCQHEATYKIAARWSDGVIGELKTYFLACETCLPTLLPLAKMKRDRCRLSLGESLGEPEVFELAKGARDTQLVPKRPK